MVYRNDAAGVAPVPVGGLDRRSRLKAIVGGSTGNLVEWFDWYVYAAFALYFAKHFFPAGDQTAQLLSSAAVAPALFRALPTDRALAGRLAGLGFEWAYAVTFAASLAVCCSFAVVRGRGPVDPSLATLLVAGSALQLFWVAPAIVRHGAGWPWSFGSLHAVGGLVHLALAVDALLLAWRLLSDA
jgi:MHS family alpha-ketoglutarate permease-like MFS transporter